MSARTTLLMAIFGVAGYFMEKYEFPLAPMILGIILGNIIEYNLRVGLLKSEGSIWPFMDNFVSIFLILCIVFLFTGEKFVRMGVDGAMKLMGKGKREG